LRRLANAFMEIKIRDFKNSDAENLLARFEGWKLFDRGRAYLEWSISFQPEQRIFLLACLDDTIIGWSRVTMSWLKVGDKIINAYYGGIFVHPDHRKKRYSFLTLSRLTRTMQVEITGKEGVFYGFPNPRLGFHCHRWGGPQPIKPIPRYVLVLRGGLFEPFRRRWLLKTTHAPKGVEIKEIHFFDERFDQLWEKASKTHKIIAMRDAEYLNWRYLKEPGRRFVIFAAERNHELLGYIILKPLTEKDRRIGSLIDIFDVQDKTVTKALFLQAVRYFAGEGADKLEFYLSDEYYETVLKSTGFVKNQDSPKAWEMLIAKSYSPGTEKNVFGNPRNWFITATDMIIA